MAHIDVAGDIRAQTAETTIDRTKYNIVKAAVGGLVHPLTFSKTLYQLGFEPERWAKKPTRLSLAPRRAASRLPTTFRFFKDVHRHFGWTTMYRGAAAGVVGIFTGGFVTHLVEQHFDVFFKDLGGDVGDLLNKKEEDLDHYEAFRVNFRQTIRRSISSTIGLTLSHPFAVLMVREIMKVLRRDHACHNVASAFLHVADDEGLPGLFAGLVPSLIANFVCVWTLFGVAFMINRFLIGIEKRSANTDERETIKNVRQYTPYLVPFVANSFAYSFEVDAVVGSVVGQRQ